MGADTFVVNSAAAFAVGFTAGLISSALDRFTKLPCWATGPINDGILGAGNAFLDDGGYRFKAGDRLATDGGVSNSLDGKTETHHRFS